MNGGRSFTLNRNYPWSTYSAWRRSWSLENPQQAELPPHISCPDRNTGNAEGWCGLCWSAEPFATKLIPPSFFLAKQHACSCFQKVEKYASQISSSPQAYFQKCLKTTNHQSRARKYIHSFRKKKKQTAVPYLASIYTETGRLWVCTTSFQTSSQLVRSRSFRLSPTCPGDDSTAWSGFKTGNFQKGKQVMDQKSKRTWEISSHTTFE